MLNRCVVLIRPKEPFFQWLRTLPDPTELSLEEYDEDSTVYLLPDFEDEEGKEDVLAHFHDILFDEILNGWWTVEADWPQNRTLEMFKEWFACEFHSVVMDLVADPLLEEEW